ncbi:MULTISPECIES: putative thiazole-containing bacteriocin maturation protein [Metabacillus]|uniref:Bacteriocin maturation protein n=2 Tax=Metabacillus TaxID=2675233 RepID=A0A179SX16_9BACI|nr:MULTISPECIES: putative thiazole-containing bacteriocin maturation protein [Metabacillus]OAS86001.1 bacteriocin maturation protein [Metabacillus litoralis]QNF30043.1 putative thiazole-containing bacteriocin maturation protein [Metabacillus sp. KUDC1714]
MTNLYPSMRLKVKRDTFFLPEANSGVYFRNNVSSFRMEGSMIDKWVEKLIPMFNGEHTLESLTNGLPGQYRDRVYEIAETLYQNGFVKDVSRDQPYQLTEQVLKKYASQIEFVDSFVESAAFRFQTYRQAKAMAIGSGAMFVSLVSALLDSGLPKFQILITDRNQTNIQRLQDLVAHARTTDPEVEVEEISLTSWKEIVEPFDYILYVSQEGNVEELKLLHRICREKKKVFIPALCLQQIGMAGPFVLPSSENCWESAWRRLHRSELYKKNQISKFSTTAGAMLANLIVFELFKNITGVTEREQNNQYFLLDLETLEGNWNNFIPHPFVTGHPLVRLVDDYDARIKRESERQETGKLLLFFNKLTSEATGIFHTWDEGDLLQLPLAQCRVQPIDPLSDGPAELLKCMICSGLTHEEARREAGLSGIEAYGNRITTLLDLPSQVQVGAGETFTESVCRGLQKYLVQVMKIKQPNKTVTLSRVQLSTVEDERCRYYLKALSTIQSDPIIGLGEEVSGFPVVWIGTKNGWYGSVDINITFALRKALQLALFNLQNHEDPLTSQGLVVSSVLLEEKAPQLINIPDCDDQKHSVLLQSAKEVLDRNGKQLVIFELEPEPILKEGLAGIFGVVVREEE